MTRALEQIDHENLGFLEEARRRFGFLTQYGLEEVRAEPTYLRFASADYFIEVYYGRRSYEVGLEVGRVVRIEGQPVEQRFGLVDALHSIVPGAEYVPRVAKTPEQVARFVDELAHLVKPVLEQLARDCSDAFDRISEGVRRTSSAFVVGLLAARERARADDAWRAKDWGTVVAAYEELEAQRGFELRRSERGRLRYAREHLDRSD